MDVSRYNINCQKAIHFGLKLVKSYGHRTLEVEHVALALVRSGFEPLGRAPAALRKTLEEHLSSSPRIFGVERIGFGLRLEAAFKKLEAAHQKSIDEALLWDGLVAHSRIIGAAAQSVSQQTSVEMPAASAVGDSFGWPEFESTAADRAPPQEAKISETLLKKVLPFTVDITALAQEDRLDPVVGRTLEVDRVIEILARKKKNNPLLLGEPGVGKSAIAEALATRIVSGQVPEYLRGTRLFSVNVGAVLAGAKYRGEIEERVLAILEVVEQSRGKILIFIDEIHMIIGAGNPEGGADIANLIKPKLASGELRCIGATTESEFRKFFSRDAALERRFQPVQVAEPSEAVAIEILRGIRTRYESHHGVQIADDAINAAVAMSAKYIPLRRLPDKAIDLIDEASSRKRIRSSAIPTTLADLRNRISEAEVQRNQLRATRKNSELKELDRQIKASRDEYDSLSQAWNAAQERLRKLRELENKKADLLRLYSTSIDDGDFALASRIKHGELPDIERELSESYGRFEDAAVAAAVVIPRINARDIAEIVQAWTGVPTGALIEDEGERLLRLEERLTERVFGQRDAIARIARAVRRARLGVREIDRPQGVFLFMGPTGVGKTEVAKALAAEILGAEGHLIQIDMSEYKEEHSVAKLIGSPPGYVGFGDSGRLAEAVRKRPYSIVLLDEIEKAHASVFDVLLQIFDEGRLTDGQGRVTDFRHTLIILTSNLAHGYSSNEEQVREVLTQRFRPEFVNRIDKIVAFGNLGKRHMELILERHVSSINKALGRRGIRVAVGPRVRQRILEESTGSAFGGRVIRRLFQRHIADSIATWMLVYPAVSGHWYFDVNLDGRVLWKPFYSKSRLLP